MGATPNRPKSSTSPVPILGGHVNRALQKHSVLKPKTWAKNHFQYHLPIDSPTKELFKRDSRCARFGQGRDTASTSRITPFVGKTQRQVGSWRKSSPKWTSRWDGTQPYQTWKNRKSRFPLSRSFVPRRLSMPTATGSSRETG